MKHIERTGEPLAFTEWVKDHPGAKWEDFSSGEPVLYRTCRQQLLDEQQGISGYTELPLADDDQHIDHFRKKGMFPKQTFDWMNYVVDTKDEPKYGAGFKDKNISKPEDYDKIINPMLEDPHQYITYLSNGQIVPRCGLDEKDTERAKFTLDIFNLQCEALRKRREELMALFKAYGTMNPDEVAQILKDCGQGFHSLLEYCANEAKKENNNQ